MYPAVALCMHARPGAVAERVEPCSRNCFDLDAAFRLARAPLGDIGNVERQFNAGVNLGKDAGAAKKACLEPVSFKPLSDPSALDGLSAALTAQRALLGHPDCIQMAHECAAGRSGAS